MALCFLHAPEVAKRSAVLVVGEVGKETCKDQWQGKKVEAEFLGLPLLQESHIDLHLALPLLKHSTCEAYSILQSCPCLAIRLLLWNRKKSPRAVRK